MQGEHLVVTRERKTQPNLVIPVGGDRRNSFKVKKTKTVEKRQGGSNAFSGDLNELDHKGAGAGKKIGIVVEVGSSGARGSVETGKTTSGLTTCSVLVRGKERRGKVPRCNKQGSRKRIRSHYLGGERNLESSPSTRVLRLCNEVHKKWGESAENTIHHGRGGVSDTLSKDLKSLGKGKLGF